MNHPLPPFQESHYADDLAARLEHSPYQAYSYSYPHKSAYRPLSPVRDLRALWAQEDKRALFAYLHIPFCSMRCGFCNLFAMARPAPGLVDAYVEQVLRQMQQMRAVLQDAGGPLGFARFAIGGGTPTYLSAEHLARLLGAARDVLGLDLQQIPAGIEASPETVSAEKLQICRAAGIQRVSLGVQSFSAGEMRALARPQQNSVVQAAVRTVREAGFPILNLDLIYGIQGQTVASLLASIESALQFAPEELYLYPLYVRAQTGLGKQEIRRGRPAETVLPIALETDDRAALYQAARACLLQAGYQQVSMRMFRAPHAPDSGGPVYCCQNDGMVGLGAGARSYTRSLHYAGAYAVERGATRDIIQAYVEQDAPRFALAEYGFALSNEEQQRRFIMQSLLTEPGLLSADYQARFGSELLHDWPQLSQLRQLNLLEEAGWPTCWRLNPDGYARADTIGPWLASTRVRELMAEQGVLC